MPICRAFCAQLVIRGLIACEIIGCIAVSDKEVCAMNERPMKPEKRCSFIKDDGKQCGGAHIRGSKYCFAHDPEQGTYRKAVASKAGKARAQARRAKGLG